MNHIGLMVGVAKIVFVSPLYLPQQYCMHLVLSGRELVLHPSTSLSEPRDMGHETPARSLIAGIIYSLSKPAPSKRRTRWRQTYVMTEHDERRYCHTARNVSAAWRGLAGDGED